MKCSELVFLLWGGVFWVCRMLRWKCSFCCCLIQCFAYFFIFYLQPFWRWPSNLHFYCRRIVQMQLLHFCNGTMTLWRAFTSYIPEINSWDDDFCTVCCSFSGRNMTVWNKTKTKQFKSLTRLVFKHLKY